MGLSAARRDVAPLGLYLLIAILFFGIPILPHLTDRYFGAAADPADPHAFIWFMHWWPHAIRHGLDPLVTHEVWSPTGFSVATATSVPVASVAAWPVTSTLGPVAAYDLLMLLAPALGAWTAFLLFRSLTGAFLPSVLGGYIFGFSSFELAHLTAHLNLSMVFLVPVCLSLVLRFFRGDLGPRAFTVLFALALTGQFLLSVEIFATMTLFGGIAAVVWLLLTRREWRGREREGRRLAGPMLLAYLAAGVLVSPLLYKFAIHGPFGTLRDPATGPYQADLLNLVIPTRVTAIGGDALSSVADRFRGNLAENGSYVGIPLLAMAVLFARKTWQTTRGKLLSILLVVIAIGSLGSVLEVAGARTIPLPWTLLQHVPLIGAALPVRFLVYLFLLLGMVAAMWTASAAPAERRGRWVLAGMSVILLLPNVASSSWHGDIVTPPFFSDAIYRRYIAPGENVLMIPGGRAGAQSLRWQIETDTSFDLTIGYLSIQVPSEFDCWWITPRLLYGEPGPMTARPLATFLTAKGVSVVVLYGPRGAPWRPVLEQIGLHPVDVGGVTVARVVPFGSKPPLWTFGPCPRLRSSPRPR
jgi:hypothetical protein